MFRSCSAVCTLLLSGRWSGSGPGKAGDGPGKERVRAGGRRGSGPGEERRSGPGEERRSGPEEGGAGSGPAERKGVRAVALGDAWAVDGRVDGAGSFLFFSRFSLLKCNFVYVFKNSKT